MKQPETTKALYPEMRIEPGRKKTGVAMSLTVMRVSQSAWDRRYKVLRAVSWEAVGAGYAETSALGSRACGPI